ncbi:DNA-binding domain-containing protein [Noviherbaspirillum sedimenti]|uniref:DUF2063 domain-containing protein n=1 Tax=Noviherbaspirillum sedimenti TaxID=2320865 RepID=A0A3A3G4M4_9BURK|nr:DNA-binding domain-containing protein [Noviherbaspirillum sedimenti]RJG03443.1 DUF2063 domain-containing protein [Noviherbaspirillum sedimenti]
MELGRFQDAFAQALLAPAGEAPPILAGLLAQPGFAVYRNTVAKGCIDALLANFPAVARLTGEAWLRSAAALYLREQPPGDARLLYYGAGFADFLARFAPAADLPWLADVARLDRYWIEVHTAADAAPLDLAALSGLAPEALARTVLRPHAAARWAWFADAPVYTLWRRNREPFEEAGEIAWQGEGALLLRPYGAVQWAALDAADCAFLDVCGAGLPLADAAAAALALRADTDLAALLARLLQLGAFGRASLIDDTD